MYNSDHLNDFGKNCWDVRNISFNAEIIDIVKEVAIIKDGKEIIVENIFFYDEFGSMFVDFHNKRYKIDEVEIIVKDIEKSEIGKNRRIINKLREQLEIIEQDCGTFREYASEGLKLLSMLESNIDYSDDDC
jgi:nitrous oxide reductase